MENNCDNAGGAKYIVDPEDNDCTHFVNCHKQMVSLSLFKELVAGWEIIYLWIAPVFPALVNDA